MEHLVNRFLEIVDEHQNRGIFLTDEGVFTPTTIKHFEKAHGSTPKVYSRVQFESMPAYQQENILKALRLIPFVVRKTSSKCMVGSYGLKHNLEKYFSHSYICNGDVILCMLYLGYKMRPDRDGWNARFGCDYVKNDATHNLQDFLKF